jgi:hypothetical protein
MVRECIRRTLLELWLDLSSLLIASCLVFRGKGYQVFSDLVSLVCDCFILVVDLIVVFEGEYRRAFERVVFVEQVVVHVNAFV